MKRADFGCGRMAHYAEQTAVPNFFDEINVVTNSFSMIADP